MSAAAVVSCFAQPRADDRIITCFNLQSNYLVNQADFNNLTLNHFSIGSPNNLRAQDDQIKPEMDRL